MANEQNEHEIGLAAERDTVSLLSRFRRGQDRVRAAVQNVQPGAPHGAPHGRQPQQQPNQPHAQAGGGGGGGGNANAGGGGNHNPASNTSKWALSLLTIVFGFLAIMYNNHAWDIHEREEHAFKNTPAGLEELRQQTLKEERKRLEAQAQLAAASAPPGAVQGAVVPQSIPTPITPPQGVCVSPHPGHTTFEQPLVLTQGTCAELKPSAPYGEYFWVKFQGVPSYISGVEKFRAARFTGTLTADGHRDVEPTEDCSGDCTEFLRRHSTEAIFVRQAVGQSLNIKM